MKRIKKQKTPIQDPVRYAEEKFGVPCRVRAVTAPWKEWIVPCTTGQFASLGKGYKRHCGPTAMTGMILTLNRRHPFLQDPRPADIFRTVVRIGQKTGIYWNTDFLGRFGGTYDILTRKYIRDCLKAFGIRQKGGDGGYSVTVHGRPFPKKSAFLQAIRDGKLLYLQLSHNARYGSHHLLCYGYTTVCSTDGEHWEVYLLLADGWSAQPRYLPLSETGICHFFEIGAESR